MKFGWVAPAPVQPEPVLPTPEAAPSPDPEPASLATSDEGFWQSPVPAYISLGVGAVGVGLGVVFLLQRSSATSDADERFEACLQSLSCVAADREAMERLDDEAATKGTLSVVSFGVGVLGLGAGALLLLMNGTPEEGASQAARVTPETDKSRPDGAGPHDQLRGDNHLGATWSRHPNPIAHPCRAAVQLLPE